MTKAPDFDTVLTRQQRIQSLWEQTMQSGGGWILEVGNSIGLARFRQAVQRVWWEWLGRRRGGNRPTWAKFLQFEQRWPLPPPIALHSVCRVRSKGVT
jgi:hypothetical protein